MLPVSVDSLLMIALSDLFNIYLYKISFCVKMFKESKNNVQQQRTNIWQYMKQKAQHWKLIETQHKPHQTLGELIHDLLPGL
jgi:hypothetical protein